MRKFFYTLLILIGGLYNVQAQLANGTIAPPFNLEDLNNNIHDLYGDYLDNDIDVILDFSATWCGPCWSYHNSGALENMYTAYGPNGTGDVMVFFIEADLNTNEACLYGPSGCVGGTQGNWVSGTAFPIINLTSTNGPGTGGAYGISYYPTTYVISSRNKKVYEPSIQPPQSLLTSWIFESFAMEATPVITNANCGGDGSIELNVVAGFGTKSFIWSNGSTSQNIYNLDPGYYSVTVTDARGYDIAVEDIEVAGIFAPLFGNVTATNNPSCFGLSDGSITVDGLFGNGNYTYNWSNGATTATVSSIPAGTYGYTITDGGGCTYEDEATIYDPAPISAAVSAPAIPCGQSTGTITITASGGAGNFLYDIGFGTQSSPVFSNLSPGMFTYVVIDGNGCQISGAVELIQNLAPAAVAMASAPITCTATTVSVLSDGSATGSNITYAWSTTDGNIVSGANASTAIVDQPGTYHLLVSNTSSGCSATSSTIVESDTQLPTLTVQNAEITCAQSQVELCASASTGATVEWTFNGTTTTANCITATVAGDYTAQATGGNGCTSSAIATVTVSTEVPQISINNPSNITCLTTEVVLQGVVNGDPNNYTYVWTTTDGSIISGGNTLMPTVDQGGSYGLLVTDNSSACTASQMVMVTEYSTAPTAEYTYTLDENNLAVVGASTGGATSYGWDFDNGMTASTLEASTVFDAAGLYNVCFSATNDCGTTTECTDIAYAESALAASVSGSSVICHDSNEGTLTATPEGGVPNYLFNWEGPNGFTAELPTITNLSAGTYTVTVTDAINTQLVSEYTIDEGQEIVQSGDVTDAQNNEDNGAIDLIVTGGMGNFTFLWSNGATTEDLTGLAEGEYSCEITDEMGCTVFAGPFTVGRVSGVDETKYITSFQIYPNPVKELLTIEATFVQNGAGVIQVINTNGQVIHNMSYDGNIAQTLDIQNYPNGTYSLHIINKEFVATRKFVVIK